MTGHATCARHKRWRVAHNERRSNCWNDAPLTAPVADHESWQDASFVQMATVVSSTLLLPRQRVLHILTGIIPAQPLDHAPRRFPDLTDNRRALADR